MELRSQTAVSFAIAAAFWLMPALGAESFEIKVRHDHLRKGCTGTLLIDERGVSFAASEKQQKPHAWRWEWPDIQRFELSPEKLRVLTYQDISWKLGADREYEFDVLERQGLDEAYRFLRNRLDQRFVAILADGDAEPLWKIPVKRLGRIRGSEGTLVVAVDRIVYRSTQRGHSRTWRYQDIENVSTSGRFELTVTTYERVFNFQLKEVLDEKRFNDLWRRLNQAKSLELLSLK